MIPAVWVVLGVLVLNALALAACRPTAVQVEPLPLPDVNVRVTPVVGLANVDTGGLLVLITVGARAGANLSCATVSVSINDQLLGTDAPDCGPEEMHQDGGVWSRQVLLGPGEHEVAVEVDEPGHHPLRVVRAVKVIG